MLIVTPVVLDNVRVVVLWNLNYVRDQISRISQVPNPFWSTLHQALASGSRSSVLKPLGWLIALTLAGSVSSHRLGSPLWLGNTIGILCIVSIILYIIFYIYFALTDKDALRSEKYSIQKLAIQKGFIGDDQTGYIAIGNVNDQRELLSQELQKGSEEGQ
jgi:hypothetical protein